MEPLQRHYKPLQSHYESLLSRYGTVTSNYQTLRAVTELDGSKEPVPYSGGRSGPKPSSEGLAPWVVPSAPLQQGDSLWISPSAHVCGRLRGGEAGRQPTSWGHYSTPVRILQVGGGRDWLRPPMGTDGLVLACALHQRKGLAWPAPLSHLPTLQRFWKQGDSPCTPAGTKRPLPPGLGERGSERGRSQFLIGGARRTSELAPDGVIGWFEPS